MGRFLYIANILRQQNARREVQPPVRLRQPELNDLLPTALAGCIRRFHSAIPTGSGMSSVPGESSRVMPSWQSSFGTPTSQ